MSFYGFYLSEYFKWIWNTEQSTMPVKKPEEKKPDEEKPEEEKTQEPELDELKNEAMRAAINDPPPIIQPRKKKKWKR